jgi:hypothetical protein
MGKVFGEFKNIRMPGRNQIHYASNYQETAGCGGKGSVDV